MPVGKMKKGFTLLELMLVVMLMGIVYGSVINVFERYKEKAIDVTFMSLQNYMQDFSHNNHVSLVCIKQCEECLLFIDEKFTQNVTPFMDKEIQLYRYDKDIGVRELQVLPYFPSDGQEEEACFRYDIYPDGSRSEMIVKDKKEVYLFPSYFGSVQKHASIEKAIEQQAELARKVAEQ
jgi:prepilin-type N-terminal cleavage/methylation domain-containing protein